MALSLANIWIVVLYFLVVIAIGFWVRKRETVKEYLIAGRKIGIFQTAASILAVVGGMLLVGQAALAYEIGFAAIWFWIGFGLGIVFLGFAAKKIKPLADKHEFLTLSDYIFTKFDYKSGILCAIILFIGFFALLTGQFIAGASLFSPLLGINYATAVFLLGIGTLIYLFLGGFKAVIKTDFLQFIIMFFVFIFLLTTIDIGQFTPEQTDLVSLGGFTTFIFLIMGTFVIFASPDIWQRLFASKSIATAKKASYISAVLFVIFGIALTIAGIAAHNNFPDIDSGEALYYGLFQLLPPALLGLAVIVILAAIMSTIDTELFFLSSSVAKDFFYRKKRISNEEMTRIIKKSLITLAFISMFVAIFVSQILIVLFGLVSLILSVSPAVIASLFWKLKNNAVFISMIGGVAAFIALIFTGTFNPDNAIVSLPAAILFLIIGQIIFKK